MPLTLAACLAATFAYFGWCRFAAVHNQTFDLAFYTRMTWGAVRGDFWMPLADAHIFGLHISPVLLPIGALGALIGTAKALLIAQALSAFGAACVLARLGQRHLGASGAWLGAFVLLLHPNLGHVLTYEAHPGSMALFPLAWAAERLDARDGRRVFYACLCVLACREDLALVGLFLAAALWRFDRRYSALCAAVSVGWFACFLFFLHPAFAPRGGSFSQHLGAWGDTPSEVLAHWLEHPLEILRHIFTGRRGTYLPRILAPLLFLPLLAPRLALPAIPVLGMNLVSVFPTTPNLDSHYLTPAIPFLAAASLVGAARVPFPRLRFLLFGAALAGAYLWAGFRGGPEFEEDTSTFDARAALALVPTEASVQAPDALLPHLAERPRLHRAPPPNRGDDYTILDISHRARYAHTPTLLRTVEEPLVRNWLQRDEYAVVGRFGRYLVFARGADPRESEHLIEETLPPNEWPRGLPLSAGMRWIDAEQAGDDVLLKFLVTAPNPADLALRFDAQRTDLLCEGELGLTHLRPGDILVSRHDHVRLEGLQVGLIRTSGAPPQHGDPRSIALAQLRLEQRSVEFRPPVPEETPARPFTP